ncbi:MAG: SCO family protein [Burkholderiales bacterium]
MAQDTALPADSVYHLRAPLINQNGKRQSLAATRGHISFVTMFYTGCTYVCPLIVETLKKTEATLDDAQRSQLRATLVSLDPAHDTPSRLKQFVDEKDIDESRWTLLTTDAKTVRKIAGVLGVQYRQLKNGEFNHSSVLLLLDGEGRILARTTTLGKVDPDFVAAARKALSQQGRS